MNRPTNPCAVLLYPVRNHLCLYDMFRRSPNCVLDIFDGYYVLPYNDLSANRYPKIQRFFVMFPILSQPWSNLKLDNVVNPILMGARITCTLACVSLEQWRSLEDL